MLSLSCDAEFQDKYCDDFFSKSDQVTSQDWRRDSPVDNSEGQVQRGSRGDRSEDFAV